MTKKWRYLIWGLVSGLILLAIHLFFKDRMLSIVDNAPVTLENFEKIFSSFYIWNDFLSVPSTTQSIFNYNTYFILIGRIVDWSLAELIVIEKLCFFLVGYIGSYLTLRYLNTRYFSRTLSRTLLVLGAITYLVNPTFLVGDNFWPSIQAGYYLTPLIAYCTLRLYDKSPVRWLCILALVLSVNTAGHFVYGGFVLTIVFVSIVRFVLDVKTQRRLPYWQYLFRLAMAGGVYLLVFAPQILGSVQVVSQAATYLTKEAIEVPWSSATIFNMIRGMTYTNISQDFYGFNNLPIPISLLLIGLTFGVPLTLFFGLFLSREKALKRTFYLCGIAILLICISIFSIEGLLKSLHYWFALSFSLGKVLRTWRVPETFSWLCVSMVIPIALQQITKYFDSPRISKYVIGAYALFLLSLAFPLLTGNLNGGVINTPTQYERIYKGISEADSKQGAKIMISPEFQSSYGMNAPLKPYWSPNFGIVTEFMGYSPPIPSIMPADVIRHFYFFLGSEFYGKTGSLLPNKEFNVASRLMALVNIRYLMIRGDGPTEFTKKEIANGLAGSPLWSPLMSESGLSLFRNRIEGSSVGYFPSRDVYYVDGGLRAIKKFFLKNTHILSGVTFAFVDQLKSSDGMLNSANVISDKKAPQESILHEKLVIRLLNSTFRSARLFFPSTMIRQHDPDEVWSVGTLSDIHQTEWHPYINRMDDYAWDYDFNKGLVFVDREDAEMSFPISGIDPGRYYLLTRNLTNDHGGEIEYSVGDQVRRAVTLDSYDGFQWNMSLVHLRGGEDKISIRNVSGFNAVSALVLISTEDYQSFVQETATGSILSMGYGEDRNLIDAGDSDSDFPGPWLNYKNLSQYQLSMENVSGRDSKKMALKVSTSNPNPEWSWLASHWIDVKPGVTYSLTTRIRTEDVVSSHIVLMGLNRVTGKTVQIAQLPAALSGTHDWIERNIKIRIPSDIGQVNLVLNAGWTSDSRVTATTWFGKMELVSLEEQMNLKFPSSTNQPCITDRVKINPTVWQVDISNNCVEDGVLVLNETYNPGWEAYVDSPSDYRSMSWSERVLKQNLGKRVPNERHIISNGVQNGWVMRADDFDVSIEGFHRVLLIFAPQRWFYVGLLVSGTTLIGCLGYLGYAWVRGRRRGRRERNDEFLMTNDKGGGNGPSPYPRIESRAGSLPSGARRETLGQSLLRDVRKNVSKPHKHD